MRLPPKTCDCGAPGVKKDGSGWFCLACELMVQHATQLIEENVRRQREHDRELDPQRIEYQRQYQPAYRMRRAA